MIKFSIPERFTMPNTMAVTAFNKNTARCLNRVSYEGKRIILTKIGIPLVGILPLNEIAFIDEMIEAHPEYYEEFLRRLKQVT